MLSGLHADSYADFRCRVIIVQINFAWTFDAIGIRHKSLFMKYGREFFIDK